MDEIELPFDTPHRAAPPALTRLETLLSLEGCNIWTIPAPLREGDKVGGFRFEQWPQHVQDFITEEVDGWRQRNPLAQILAITQGVAHDSCIMSLHWKPKG